MAGDALAGRQESVGALTNQAISGSSFVIESSVCDWVLSSLSEATSGFEKSQSLAYKTPWSIFPVSTLREEEVQAITMMGAESKGG